MNKKMIRLTESDLHNIIKESVNKVLKEYFFPSTNPNDTDSIEDYDEMTRWRRGGQKSIGDEAQNYHPQRDNRIDARNYAKVDPAEYGNDLGMYRRHMDKLHGLR